MYNVNNGPIVIVGAGICGLTAALALHKKGFEVRVIEQRENVIGEKGTAFNIWSNAVTALKYVGLGDDVISKGIPIKRQTVRSCKGQLLMDTPIGEITQEIGTPSVNIRRSDLIELIYDACKDIPIQFGLKCKRYYEHDDIVTIELNSGERVKGQALIGADGMRSSVRAQLIGDGDPTYMGYTIWRGISEGIVEHEPGNVSMYWGPGLNGGYWAIDKNHVSWTLGLNTASGGKDDIGKIKSKLLKLVTDFPDSFKDAIKLTPEEKIFRVDGYSRTNIDKWGEGRITLVGDAAHASPTVYGQGACQAIEDAIILAERLSNTPDIVMGLRQYEQQRKSRVDWIRSKIFLASSMQKLSDPVTFYLKCMYVANFLPKEENLKTWKRLLTFGD